MLFSTGLLAVALLVQAQFAASAQSNTRTGTFSSANGEPLAGVAITMKGLEAWAEQCRPDCLQLTACSATVLNGKLLLRFIYPGTEQSVNGSNDKAAVAGHGADLLATGL